MVINFSTMCGRVTVVAVGVGGIVVLGWVLTVMWRWLLGGRVSVVMVGLGGGTVAFGWVLVVVCGRMLQVVLVISINGVFAHGMLVLCLIVVGVVCVVGVVLGCVGGVVKCVVVVMKSVHLLNVTVDVESEHQQ